MMVAQDSVHTGITPPPPTGDPPPPADQPPLPCPLPPTPTPPPPPETGTTTGCVTVTGKEPIVSTIVKIEILKFAGFCRLITPFATKVAICVALSGVEVAEAMTICEGLICVTKSGVDDSEGLGACAKSSTAVAISVFC